MNMSIPTICTLFVKRRLAYARALAQSFFAQHPNGRMVALLIDEIDGNFDPAAESFEIIPVESLNIPGFPAMTMRYTQQALCAAVKPFFLTYLLQEKGYDRVCYFDPATTIHAPLDDLFSLLETKLMVLTPHLLEPLQEDRFQPNEQTILQQGTYNLGFLGLSNHPDCGRFLHWWQQHTQRDCTAVTEDGPYLDQRWMDLTPALFEDVHIHREPGCGAGYWNLGQRAIEKSASGYTVNDAPLTFFHYSGLQMDNMEAISRYQNRYTLGDFPQLQPLFAEYRKALLGHGQTTVGDWPYTYDTFDNGVPISTVLRQIWQQTKSLEVYWPAPRNTSQRNSFFDWLNQPEDSRQLALGEAIGAESSEAGETHLVTNLAMALWRVQPDLQRKFPSPLGPDRSPFIRWFVEQAESEFGIDSDQIEPMRLSLSQFAPNPISNLYHKLKQPVDIWFYATYKNETWLYQLYLKFRGLLATIGVAQWIEGSVADELSQRNFVSLAPTGSSRRQSLQSTVSVQASLGVNVAGFLRDESGLGRTARDLIIALRHYGVPVAQTTIPAHPDRDSDYAILEQLPKGNPYPINLVYIGAGQFYTHHMIGSEFFQEKYNIGFLWSESTRFPQGWQDASALYDELWAGTRFVQDTLTAITPQPTMQLNIAIPAMGQSSLTRADLNLPQDKYIFLFIFDPMSGIRKNPLAVIDAYEQAFAPHFDKTLLILKAKSLGMFPELSQQLQSGLERVSGMLIDCSLPRAEMDALFQVCDTYVSLHRAEGYGATMAEAMQLGKPVIATGYSGNMDFMTPENSYPVSYQLVEQTEDTTLFAKGTWWAEPDVDEAARYMQQVVHNPAGAQQKGELARQQIEQEYNVETVAKAIINRLEAIHTHRGYRQLG